MKLIFLTFLLLTITLSNCSLLFRLKNSEPHCLGGEYFENSVLVVKYKIFTPSRKNLNNIFPYLALYLHNAKTNEKIKSERIYTNKSKFTFDIKQDGLYEVCIQTNRFSVIADLKESLYINLKMNPDFIDEENLFSNAINSQDVNSVNVKTRQIINLTKPIIENQKNRLTIENEESIRTLANAAHYKYLAYAQLVIIIIIGIVQLYNFKRFLKSQNVI